MGTRTVDGTGTDTEAGTAHDETAADATGSGDADATETEAEATRDAPGSEDRAPSGVGQGAAAVVSAALGLVSLTGSRLGTVAAARRRGMSG
ncbi:hypothetical protein KYY02_16625 [Streptomyces pimonensis]|uniref:Uncharacterized protein n=1 Tax=Streptomyces pimonensis TaxID=2860288 RepID=A0ABV4IZZ7_9ACTN